MSDLEQFPPCSFFVQKIMQKWQGVRFISCLQIGNYSAIIISMNKPKKDTSKHRPKKLNGGRPRLFPDAIIEKRMVTLPEEIWRHIDTVNNSISVGIFEIVNKDMKRKMKREAKKS